MFWNTCWRVTARASCKAWLFMALVEEAFSETLPRSQAKKKQQLNELSCWFIFCDLIPRVFLRRLTNNLPTTGVARHHRQSSLASPNLVDIIPWVSQITGRQMIYGFVNLGGQNLFTYLSKSFTGENSEDHTAILSLPHRRGSQDRTIHDDTTWWKDRPQTVRLSVHGCSGPSSAGRSSTLPPPFWPWGSGPHWRLCRMPWRRTWPMVQSAGTDCLQLHRKMEDAQGLQYNTRFIFQTSWSTINHKHFNIILRSGDVCISSFFAWSDESPSPLNLACVLRNRMHIQNIKQSIYICIEIHLGLYGIGSYQMFQNVKVNHNDCADCSKKRLVSPSAPSDAWGRLATERE